MTQTLLPREIELVCDGMRGVIGDPEVLEELGMAVTPERAAEQFAAGQRVAELTRAPMGVDSARAALAAARQQERAAA